jgi:hypothetical protein
MNGEIEINGWKERRGRDGGMDGCAKQPGVRNQSISGREGTTAESWDPSQPQFLPQPMFVDGKCCARHTGLILILP